MRELQSAVKYALVHSVGEDRAESLPAGCNVSAAARPPRRQRAARLNVAQYARDLLDAGQADIYRRVHGEVDRILLPEVLNGSAATKCWPANCWASPAARCGAG